MDLAITETTALTMQESGVGPVVRGSIGVDETAVVEQAQDRAAAVFTAGTKRWRGAGSALVEDAAAGRL